MYILMSIGSWAQEAIFTQVWSRDTSRINFPSVDGLSMDTPGHTGYHSPLKRSEF